MPGRRISAGSLDQGLATLERAGARVLVIGTTPRFEYAIPSCVVRRDERTCRILRSKHDSDTVAANELLTAVVARHPNTRLWDPAARYCDAHYCYPSQDGTLMFRDEHHLSRRGAQTSVLDLKPALDWLLQTSPETPRQQPPAKF